MIFKSRRQKKNPFSFWKYEIINTRKERREGERKEGKEGVKEAKKKGLKDERIRRRKDPRFFIFNRENGCRGESTRLGVQSPPWVPALPIANLYYDLGQRASLFVPQFPRLYSEDADRKTKAFFRPAGCQECPVCARLCAGCWGYGGKHRTSPVPARRTSEPQGKPRPGLPEMFKPLLEIHGHAWVLLGQQEQRGTCYVAAASLPPNCISWPAYSLASTPAPCVRGHLIAPHPRPLTFYFQGQDLAGYILAHHALS